MSLHLILCAVARFYGPLSSSMCHYNSMCLRLNLCAVMRFYGPSSRSMCLRSVLCSIIRFYRPSLRFYVPLRKSMDHPPPHSLSLCNRTVINHQSGFPAFNMGKGSTDNRVVDSSMDKNHHNLHNHHKDIHRRKEVTNQIVTHWLNHRGMEHRIHEIRV